MFKWLIIILLCVGCSTTKPDWYNTVKQDKAKRVKVKQQPQGNDKSCPTFGGKSKCK